MYVNVGYTQQQRLVTYHQNIYIYKNFPSCTSEVPRIVGKLGALEAHDKLPALHHKTLRLKPFSFVSMRHDRDAQRPIMIRVIEWVQWIVLVETFPKPSHKASPFLLLIKPVSPQNEFWVVFQKDFAPRSHAEGRPINWHYSGPGFS